MIMRRAFLPRLLLLWSGYLAGIPCVAWAGLVVVDEGRPRATLIIPDQATAWELLAARRFQDYVEKISGARLAIRNEADDSGKEGNHIYIGSTRASANVREGFTGDNAREESSLVRVKDRTMYITGFDDAGTLHAVYFVLEDFGCRWYFPAEWGTVIPRSGTLTVKDQNTYRAPDFKIRRGIVPISVSEDPDPTWAIWEWGRGNHLGGWHWWGSGHSYNYLVPPSNFSRQPDWFAYSDGKRRPTQLCTTNPEVRTAGWRNLERELKAAYHGQPPRLICISPNDGQGFCECPNCQKLIPDRPNGKGKDFDNSIDRIVDFANFFADRLARTYPQCYVTYYCNYHSAGIPTRVKPAQNTVFWLTHWADDQFHGVRDTSKLGNVINEWSRFGNPLFIYTYWGSYGSYTFWPIVHALKCDVPYFKQKGVIGVYSETHQNWGGQHLNFIVYPRLLWNAHTDVDAWVDDFCARFYGPAAKPMRRYYALLEESARNGPAQYHSQEQLIPVFNPDVLTRLRGCIGQAQAAVAKADPVYRKRLDFVAKGFELGDLYFSAQHLMRRHSAAAASTVRARVAAMYERMIRILHFPDYRGHLIGMDMPGEAVILNAYDAIKRGTRFPPGQFKYSDKFIQGGRTSLDAARRVGFHDGWWGLDMDGKTEGELTYRFDADNGTFERASITALAGPAAQVHMAVDVRTVPRGPWTTAASNAGSTSGLLTLPVPLTPVVAGAKAFEVRLRLRNNTATYLCGLWEFSIEGNVVPLRP